MLGVKEELMLLFAVVTFLPACSQLLCVAHVSVMCCIALYSLPTSWFEIQTATTPCKLVMCVCQGKFAPPSPSPHPLPSTSLSCVIQAAPGCLLPAMPCLPFLTLLLFHVLNVLTSFIFFLCKCHFILKSLSVSSSFFVVVLNSTAVTTDLDYFEK